MQLQCLEKITPLSSNILSIFGRIYSNHRYKGYHVTAPWIEEQTSETTMIIFSVDKVLIERSIVSHFETRAVLKPLIFKKV